MKNIKNIPSDAPKREKIRKQKRKAKMPCVFLLWKFHFIGTIASVSEQ